MVVETINDTELRFKNPGRLLLVVFAFIFWGVGFLDLLGHTSAEPDVFGLYSLPFFALILLYGCTVVIWFALFFNSNLLSRVAEAVRYIQNKTLLAIASFAGIGSALWVIFEWDRWARLPGLQFTAFGLLVLAGLILLIANWNENLQGQTWRRIIAYPLIALLIVEIILQAAARLGVLPGEYAIGGDYFAYERIYANGEGFRNGFANRYGWSYPDAALDDDRKRVLIVGGSYVQALQVPPDQQVTAQLMNLVNSDQMEVVAIGLSGFGLSPFLYDDVMTELPNLIKIDEMIVFFHLGDDFQSPVPAHNSIRYVINDTEGIQVHPQDARLRHDLTHYYLRSYLSFQLVETLRSNYLTPKVITSLLRGQVRGEQNDSASGKAGMDFPRLIGSVTDSYDMTEPTHAGIKTTDLEIIRNGNSFMFVQGGTEDTRDAFVITESMLETAQELARSMDITLRVVTIPVFPAEFYDSYQSVNWQPRVGEYDLFMPEQALVEIANRHDIPILAMGEYMLEKHMTVEEIQALYMSNDQGSFTSQGHQYFAEAIYSCFYSSTADSCSD